MARIRKSQVIDLVRQWAKIKGLHHRLLPKHYCVSAYRYGWSMQPFGCSQVFLGETLAEAHEALEAMIEESKAL